MNSAWASLPSKIRSPAKLTYGKLLTGAAVLGAKFRARFPETNLGVMLPNANGAAATLLGVMTAGKVLKRC